MTGELAVVVLLAIATGVALATRWVRVPYTVALVVVGLALGAARVVTAPELTKELLYAVFLPGLLFEAAFHVEFHEFWRSKRAIVALAIPGVVLAIAATALPLAPAVRALGLDADFGLGAGLVFAAMIAATDPIAVVGLFKTVGAPHRLAVLVESESLLNDGTAVVLFTLILAAVSGGETSVAGAAGSFVLVVMGGLAVGAVFGVAISWLTSLIEDPMVEITLTTLAAYGSFIVAEKAHVSGVIATVTAGMLCGNYGARVGMSASTRLAVRSFWEYAAFALNSLVFLLLGFQVHVTTLLASWAAILVAYVAVTLARFAVIAVVTLLLRRSTERIPASWAVVLGWGGLRGALSVVLALGLPAGFPHREFLITLTYGVVVLSIVVQGSTMSPLLRRLGLGRPAALPEERQRAELVGARAALRALEDLVRTGAVHPHVARRLEESYRARAKDAEAKLSTSHADSGPSHEAEVHSTRQRLLVAEKDAVLDAVQKGLLAQDAAEPLVASIDDALVEQTLALDATHPPGREPVRPTGGEDGTRE